MSLIDDTRRNRGLEELASVFPTKCGWCLNVDLTFCHSFTWVIFFVTLTYCSLLTKD